MQKKIYIMDLCPEEIMQRLQNGEKIYIENSEVYVKLYQNMICDYDKDNNITFFGRGLLLCDNTKYFLDNVEEPEADESCVGKLCYFWDTSEERAILSILKKAKTLDYCDETGTHWEHCRPLTKEEVLKLIKE